MKPPSPQLGVVLPSQPGEAHRNGGRLVERGELNDQQQGELNHELRGVELIHNCDVLNNDTNDNNDNDNMDLLQQQ